MLEAYARAQVFVLTAHGEWDLATAPAMPHLLVAGTSGLWPVVTVDLGDVTFLDPAGARPLRAAAIRAHEAGIRFFLVHPTEPVNRVLTICGLGPHVVPVEQLPKRQELLDLFAPTRVPPQHA